MTDGNPLLVDTGRGFSVYHKKRHLYTLQRPETAAEKKASLKKIIPGTIIFLPSPLLFYGVNTLLKKLPEDTLIIAVEIDPALFSLCKEREKCIPDDSRLLFTGDDVQKILKFITDSGLWRYRRVELITLSGGYALHKKEYVRLMNILTATIKEYWQNRMTMIHLGPLWIKNIFSNIKMLTSRTESQICWNFKHFTGSRPLLVVGAGESIEYSIPEIKKNRQNILILAVDTAVTILNFHGIEPDFIVAVDAQIYNLYDILGFKKKNTPLFFDLTCYPELVRNFTGKLFPFLSSFTTSSLIKRMRKEFPDLKIFPALGSVGVIALYIANQFTSGPVLFTGLDFSYTVGKSHANGSPVHLRELFTAGRFAPPGKIAPFFQRPYIIITDKNGRKTYTNSILLSYAALLRDYFADNPQVYDIGKTGILLTQNRNKEIREILDTIHAEKKGSMFLSHAVPSHILNTFLYREKARLDHLYSKIYLWLSEKKGDPKEILSLLKDADYLYLHFPDQSPEPKMKSEYLKRILVSITHYLSVLTTLSITLENREKS